MFVFGIYPNEEQAADALSRLVDAGFPIARISGLMHEGQKVEELPVEGKTGVARGAVIGAALGVLGGALLTPAGGLLATGPLIAALEGATIGGAAGMGVGALTGLGFWREELDLMHRHLFQGDVIIGVETIPERRQAAEAALRAAKAKEVRASRNKQRAIRDVERAEDPAEPT